MDNNIEYENKWYNELDKWYNSKHSNLLLYGKCGIGKSYIAVNYLKDKNHEIFNYSINDIKNKQDFYELLKDILKTKLINSLFNKSMKEGAIIIDDINFNNFNKIELNNLLQYKKNKKFKNKIILISNNNVNLGIIQKFVYQIYISPPNYTDMYNLCDKLLKKKDNISYIINNCEKDYRKLIYLCDENNKNIELNIFKKKDIDIDILNFSEDLYSKYTNISNSIDRDDVFLMTNILYENTYNKINNKKKYIKEITNIYNILGDIYEYETYIQKNNQWELNMYIYTYGCKNISFNYNKIKNIDKNNKEINYAKITYYNNCKYQYQKNKLEYIYIPYFFDLKYNRFYLFIQYLLNLNKENLDYLYKNYNIKKIYINKLLKYSINKYNK